MTRPFGLQDQPPGSNAPDDITRSSLRPTVRAGGPFEAQLVTAIGSLPKNTAEARQAIYRKVRTFVTFSKFAHLAPELELTIARIEGAYSAPAAPRASAPADDHAASRWSKIPLPNWRIGLPAASLAIAALAAVFVVSRNPSDPEFDRGTADYSASSTWFDGIPSMTTYYVTKSEGGDRFLEIAGPAPLFSNTTYPVDPARTYKVSARVRVVKDDPAAPGATVSIGVIGYNEAGELTLPPYGERRLAAFNAQPLTSADGWVTGEGLMTGEAAEGQNQFSVGTRSVRLVALLNGVNPAAVSQIDYLRFEQVPGP